MRKYLYLVCLTVALLASACNPTNGNQPDNKITLTLDPVTVQLKVGDMITIETEGNATNIQWQSSNEDVATIYYGVVTAKSIGAAVITATSGTTTATANIFVTGTDGASLRITPPVVSLKVGDTFDFSYGNTYDLELTWQSSDTQVATIDQNGHLTALKPGNTTITLSTPLESVTALVAVEHNWGEYKLVWSDEFDGPSIDESVWGYNTGGGGWGNNEKQYYTNRPENARIENGMLLIEARKESYQNNEYTSARLLTKDKKTFTYGRVEARIKFPGGQGTWPAFWMMGNTGGWPACGEIDIMEHVGNIPNRASFALHTPDKNGSRGNNWVATKWFDYSLADDFHVYAVEWAEQEKDGKDVIRFFVDGVQYAETWETKIDDNNSWPFNKPHFIILNLAIGGNMGGKVDDAIFNEQRIMYVDYVRVYQRQEK